MPRTWNIVEAEDNISNKFPPCKRSIPCKACKHFTRYMSVFLILLSDVFVQALRKIGPKITLYALSTLSVNWSIIITIVFLQQFLG